jgi:hypothetical protein
MVSYSCPTNAYDFIVVFYQEYHDIMGLYSAQFFHPCAVLTAKFNDLFLRSFFRYFEVFTKI